MSGELLIQGPSVFNGYWNNKTETEKVFCEINQINQINEINKMNEGKGNQKKKEKAKKEFY